MKDVGTFLGFFLTRHVLPAVFFGAFPAWAWALQSGREPWGLWLMATYVHLLWSLKERS